MFALGLSPRPVDADHLFTTASRWRIAAIPMAMPTVLQVDPVDWAAIDLAAHGAIVKELRLGRDARVTSAINSDKTGTLTHEPDDSRRGLDPTDRYAITGTGYGLDGEVSMPPATPTRSTRRSCRS